MGRSILKPEIFDVIEEAEAAISGDIKINDVLNKLDSLYGVEFEGTSYNIVNRLDWLKTSISYALDDKEFRDDLIDYMKSYI